MPCLDDTGECQVNGRRCADGWSGINCQRKYCFDEPTISLYFCKVCCPLNRWLSWNQLSLITLPMIYWLVDNPAGYQFKVTLQWQVSSQKWKQRWQRRIFQVKSCLLNVRMPSTVSRLLTDSSEFELIVLVLSYNDVCRSVESNTKTLLLAWKKLSILDIRLVNRYATNPWYWKRLLYYNI